MFKKLFNIVEEQDIDRLDLKIFGGWEGETKNLVFTLYKSDDEKIFFDEKTTLIRQTNTNLFIYNVNPSIWKTTAFKEVHSEFIDRDYRNIENGDEASLTQKQLIELVANLLNLKKKDEIVKNVQGIFQMTNYGLISMN